ncbi:MAG: penicillin acylase family protein, partial [Chloroflexi bacterium]|nr:penicillin acylase family protein [Chloroflexota bacterium]
YRDGDLSSLALNILPPGQGRHQNTLEFAQYTLDGSQPENNTDQSAMYDALVGKAPTLVADDLDDLFKDASFGVMPDDVVRTYEPRAGTTIARDRFGVPHVYGETRVDTMFGAGYVSGEDRLFMMDVLRHLARGRLSEFLGASDDNVASDRAQRLVADYTEEELVAMGERLDTLDPELGAIARADLDAFAEGVNAFIDEALLDPTKLPAEYPALQQLPAPWKATDSIAESTLIGGQFSVGGGGQLANDAFLDALEAAYPAAEARAIFDDFRFANDPEAPTSTGVAFPFNDPVPPVDPDAVARPDDPPALATAVAASLLPPEIDGPFGRIRLAAPAPASNALLVSAELSSSGRPLAVMGPQVGYFSPQILMEIDMHGPGVHARGAAFPGISLYALLGRGADYAWSATTAFGDHIDIRAVKLCEPGGGTPTTESSYYLDDGDCAPLYQRTDSWLAKPSAGGTPDLDPPGPDAVLVSMDTARSRHGIVISRGTVEGAPVAFVRERSSYNKEVDATLTFVEIHDPDRIST